MNKTRRKIQKLTFEADDGFQTYSPPTEPISKLPRLTGRMTIREKTVINPATSFFEHAETFYHDVANVSEKSIALTKKKCKTLMNLLIPRLRGNKFDIQFKDPIHVGSVYDDLPVFNASEIEVLLPFEPGNVTIETLESGYVSVMLPKQKKGTYDDVDKWRYGRSDDGPHLSPIKTTKSIHKIFERALKHPFEIESVELTPVETDVTDQPYRILLIVNEKLKIHITPTLIQKDGNTGGHKPYIVTRPYAYDEHPISDIRWRCNYWQRESKIIKTVHLADRGTRRQAYRTFKAFILRDPRLEMLTSYQLKTVFLHFLDDEVECSPRWQRDPAEACFRALLQNLSEFLRMGRLSHFFVSGFNLFDNMPEKAIAVIRGRVTYLVNNEKEVIRMLKKRPKLNKESKTKSRVSRTSGAHSELVTSVMDDRLPMVSE